MKALIVDAGNTRTVAAAWPGPEAMPALGGDPVPLTEVAAWPRGEEPTSGFLDLAATVPVVLVSVVPDETSRMGALVPDLRVVDSRSHLPYAFDVQDLAAVGADRLANVAAAHAAGLASALIVDAGTATTFDLLLDGCFRGGMIAPGMAFAARRLGEEAARLAPVPFEKAGWQVGTDTEAAMRAGAWHAGVGGVRAVIEGILGEYGPVPVILTGGLGGLVAWDGAHIDPQWTLRGAASLALSPALD